MAKTITVSKFQVRICTCGRIHFILQEDIDAALLANKELWLSCGGCGKTSRIGADVERDWLDPEGLIYNMYTIETGVHENYELTAESFETTKTHKGILKVIHSIGKSPVMLTGMKATHYTPAAGRFEDSWYPDFWKIERTDITTDEIFQFIEQWKNDRITVNMDRLLRDLTEEEADCLSSYIIDGLDWTNTKYAYKYR